VAPNLDEIRDQQRDTWDRFSAGWKKWDAIVLGWLAPFGAAMIQRAELHDDSHVLDVGAGTGEPGLTVDLAEGMLAVAAETAARRGLHNLETQVCDAGALPFDDASFDAVLCRFGFMFFPDIEAAGREMARVARPGARVCAAVWSAPEANPWATTIRGAIARRVEIPAPPPDSPGLFRCAAEGFMRNVFAEAGLRDITEEQVSGEMVHETPEQYWAFVCDISAPVVAGLARVDEATREQIRADVLDLAAEFRRDGAVHLRSTATIISGTR
jgi:ubiquinone/menaquinone biosynthesis C-methylase UbiE